MYVFVNLILQALICFHAGSAVVLVPFNYMMTNEQVSCRKTIDVINYRRI